MSETTTPPETPAALTATLRWLPLILIGAELIFVVINLGNYALGYPSQLLHLAFYLDKEANIPAWFSSMQLFLIAVVVVIAAFADDTESKPSHWFFSLIAFGFIFLSVDEAAFLHEQFSFRLTKLDWMPGISGDRGSWIVLYAAIGGVVVLANIRNIVACADRFRKEAMVAGLGAAVFLGGAVGAEIVSYEFTAREASDLNYVIQVAIEEFLEMLGATVMLYAALLLLAKRYGFRL